MKRYCHSCRRLTEFVLTKDGATEYWRCPCGRSTTIVRKRF